MVLVVAFLVPLPVDDKVVRAYSSGDAYDAHGANASAGAGGGGGGETSGMAKLIPKLAAEHPAVAALAASGHAADVEVRIVNSQLPVPRLLAELADATAISGYNGIWLAPREVPWLMPSPEELVAALPKLKCIQMTSAGYNALDVPGLAAKGIVVANNGGANAVSVAEHTLTLLLALQHRLVEMHTHVQAGDWSSYAATPHRELAGSTVGIVGFGNIGRLVARKLAGFEVELLYADTDLLPPGRDGELGATRVPLEELLARSDVVTLHVPLVPSTVGLIGAAELALMKLDAILLNTCRGAVVDECAVTAALEAGKLGGFGADVLVDEPPRAGHPLLALPTVLITPHLAGTAAPASARSFAFAIENMARLAKGEQMLCVVDPADFAVPAAATPTESVAAPAVRAELASGVGWAAPARGRLLMPSTGRLQKLHTQLDCASGATAGGGLLSTMGVPYTDSRHERHTLDIYHTGGPAASGSSQLKPVLFYIHGGGWERGDSTMVTGSSWFADPRFADLGKKTADSSGEHPWGKPEFFVSELGYIFVSINYRLLYPSVDRNDFWANRNPSGPKSTETVRIGTMVEDCAKAMRWVHDHASEFGGDGAQITVMGHSAGAQLAALLCTDPKLLQRQGLELGSVVKACIPIDGDTYDVPAVIASGSSHGKKFGALAEQQELSAALHCWRGQGIPPFLALHIYVNAPENKYSTAHQTRILATALGKAGVRCDVVGTPNKQHITLDSEIGKPGDFITAAVTSFLQSV